ncbi:MAG: hypothetical protein JO184_10285 [Gammaproteobacteria bacterium]|nr:hypothetical protein [Gammaproteobacteria bacterium]MBV8402982.1 hypothetical protein [Gammaproteobacteria bacterium]
MGFIDVLVNRSFRNDQQGRVVVFDGVGQGRGYLLRSTADEQRIRAFLRMYVFAELAIQLLGTLLVAAWLSSVFGATGRPTVERELLRGGFFLAAYTVVVGVPFYLMWRAYRQAVPSFVSAADAVAVSWQPMDRTQRIALTLLVLLALAAVLAIIHSCALAGAAAIH